VRRRGAIAVLGSLLFAISCPESQGAPAVRPPAVPLVTCDPYFSIWSFTDHLTDSNTCHWTGARQALTSPVRIDGRTYRLMGASPADAPALPQVRVEVTPTRTIYRFKGGGIHVDLTFMIAALPADLEVFSRPVAYLSWELRSVDGRSHKASIYYDNTAELVVNTTDQAVAWTKSRVGNLAVMRMGTQDQPILAKSGDNRRIDWGYIYVATPQARGVSEGIKEGDAARSKFLRGESLSNSDDTQMPRPARDRMPVQAVEFDLPPLSRIVTKRHVILGYDQIYSVELLHQRLRPYWRRKGLQADDLLREAEKDFANLKAECEKFDGDFRADMTRVGGEAYADLAALSYRQAFAANELAADAKGQPLFFPKENFSDGSISTPDVIHPESPILLLFNPELLGASLVPIFIYVTSGRWRFPFAPAQLGTYPLANGQTYGGGEASEKHQMPVEETGNMLIMTAAVAQVEKSPELAVRYWPVLSQWAQYLKEKGLDPDKQLCTDDFAGPMAHNANLSLKAIEALGAYSFLCKMRGDAREAASYRQTAEDYARRWMAMARDGEHFRLAFDQPGSWGLKYNLVWDRLLGLNLFRPSFARTEVAYYERKLLKLGFPLDGRNLYTKLDWEVWSASLAESPTDFQILMSPVFNFADQTPSRVPLPDWYDARDGKQCLYRDGDGRQIGFQARPVVGGVFIKSLMDTRIWKVWSSKALRPK
jgi:hypothetical protein